MPMVDGIYVDNNFTKEENEYIDNIVNHSNGIMDYNVAIFLFVIIKCHPINKKEKSLKLFKHLAYETIKEYGLINSMMKINFMIPILVTNNVISKEEGKELEAEWNKFFTDIIKEKADKDKKK